MPLNNFFMIVGGQKCGTTSMHNWLNQHPDFCMSTPKEPKFFEIDYYEGPYWYQAKYFDNWRKFHGEARVQNILVGYVPERIELYNPDTKIIIMVRNPIDRFISAWNHFKVMRPGREIRTLGRAVTEGIMEFDMNCFDSEEKFARNLDPKGGPYGGRYVEHGMYIEMIPRFTERFETKVIVMEDLIRHPKIVYDDVLEFLGADGYMPEFNKLNSKKYEVEEDGTREVLRNLYYQSVDKLGKYLGRDLLTEWSFRK